VSREQLIRCDRCGDVVTESTADRQSAGRLYAATLDGADKVGTSVTPADLCGACMDDLVQFMGGRSLEDPHPSKAKRKEAVPA
jgi:ribosomal protein S27E